MTATVLQYEDYTRSLRLDAEVVVVGTGAGGAVVGAELAEAGFDVTFVEEGGYHRTESFEPYLRSALPRLYRDAGATMILGEPSFPYAEGRCVGGSTVINGAMSYRPPEHILDGWARDTGADDLSPRGLEAAFERVEERIHASGQAPESIGGDNRIQRQGAERLGWRYSENPRSQDHCVGANACVTGCPTGAKQSTLVSYMPRALAAGARCLTEVRVERLLIERGRCVGVAGRAMNPVTRRRDRKIEIRAHAVVVACGAVQTPTLLLKHRLGRPSRQLGRNFLCHPNAKMVGLFPYEIQGWKGVSQAGQIRELQDDGVVLGINFIPPGIVAMAVDAIADASWETMVRYNHMVVGACLVEDSTSGRVHRAPFGHAVVRYDITERDRDRFVRGSLAMAELWFEMGAEAVALPFIDAPIVDTMDDLRAIDLDRIRRRDLELFTVHLMGTARMGARPDRSVIDLSGQLWDLPGCFVADASVFPSAIGVNPQVTIMAMATRIAGRMIQDRGRVMSAA
ncbi:MAG: GMC family oxidoreductase [Myxococcota bacterium]|nr:GMC family oxidoreductase [Myxococcota bacterium]